MTVNRQLVQTSDDKREKGERGDKGKKEKGKKAVEHILPKPSEYILF